MMALRKIGVSILGSTLVLVGIALLVLPGPGIITIVAGLALLGTEYHAPRRLIQPLRDRLARARAQQETKEKDRQS